LLAAARPRAVGAREQVLAQGLTCSAARQAEHGEAEGVAGSEELAQAQALAAEVAPKFE
jgi:hypothetical protein